MTNYWKAGIVIGSILLLGLISVSPLFAADAVRTATISELRGNVEVRMAGSGWQPAEVGMILHERDEIRSEGDAYIEVLLDEKGQTGKFDLEGDSHLTLSGLTLNPATGDKKTLLELAIGRVLVQAGKLEGNSTFEVKTPTATAGVRGTLFEVIVEREEL